MSLRTNHYADRYLDMSNLSTDCWYDGNLIAVFSVDHKNHTAVGYQTPDYDGQLEKYYVLIERFGFKILEIRKVTREEIFEIRNATFARSEPRRFQT